MPNAAADSATKYAQVERFTSGSAREIEGKRNLQPSSCSYAAFLRHEDYTEAVQHAHSLSKLNNWAAEANKQARNKLQSVAQLGADLHAEQIALVDHRVHHLLNAAESPEDENRDNGAKGDK